MLTVSSFYLECKIIMLFRLTTLAAGSEDSYIRLYDLRALKELATYSKDKDFKSINSIAFSKSGQILFASSSSSHTIHMWDLLDDGQAFATYVHVNILINFRNLMTQKKARFLKE